MSNLICAIAGAIAAYGAVQTQLEDPAGKWLLIGGAIIVVVAMVNEYWVVENND